MQFLRRALDEPGAEHCGKCSSCLQHPLLSPDIDSGLLHAANLFIKHADLSLNLNKQVAAGAFTQYGFKGNLPAILQGSTGRILSRWGDSGWGKQVAQEKKTGRFSDELVEACAEMVRQRWNPHPEPTWVCCVPSLKHLDLVPDFARRLAAKLGLPFIDAIEKVLNGDFTIENRMMLEPYVERGCVSHEINLALNEVCITNSVCSRMIKLSVEVNGEYFDTFRADGIIVSTPTGSTAYNLSAGGPILSPHTELMTITHICPHTLYARPFVIDGNDVVRIRVQSNYNNVQMSCDGQSTVQMKNDDVIIVKKSRYVTRIIKTTNMNFYDILRRKMVEVRI